MSDVETDIALRNRETLLGFPRVWGSVVTERQGTVRFSIAEIWALVSGKDQVIACVMPSDTVLLGRPCAGRGHMGIRVASMTPNSGDVSIRKPFKMRSRQRLSRWLTDGKERSS